MITAGFREVGGEGIEREKQLLNIIRKYGMRMIGPNCMGIINTDPAVSMNASFSPTELFAGNVAFISQSGALGVAVLEISKTLRLGFSIFVSVGNKADLTDTDFLEYLENHPRTKVITLYQESLENTAQFREVVSRINRKKPVIALKAGRSESGAKAAASHTGALASSDIATEAFFKQCGILRVGSLEAGLVSVGDPVELGRRYEELWVKLIERAQSDGSIRPDVDPWVLMKGIVGMCNSTLFWFTLDGRYSSSEVAETFADMILAGIAID